jgi:ABC-type branched-subunit amino acid transport system permease subunit
MDWVMEAAMQGLAQAVLLLHFMIAAFIAAGLVFIPLGGLWGWRWVRRRRLRLAHAALMLFVAFEAVIGMACPLTVLEAYLRQTSAPTSFWAHQIERLLYWDLPLSFFLWLYLICAVWVCWLWWRVPPLKD